MALYFDTICLLNARTVNAIVTRRRPVLLHKILPCSLVRIDPCQVVFLILLHLTYVQWVKSVVMLAGFGELVQEQRLHDTSVRIDLCNR